MNIFIHNYSFKFLFCSISVYLILLLSPFTKIYSQAIDSTYENIIVRLAQYEKTQDLRILYSLGHDIPMGIYVLNAEKTTPMNYDLIRRPRTELYMIWVDNILQKGYDINYDPEAPENLCLNTSGTFSLDSSLLKSDYHENCEKQLMHLYYRQVMQNFGCHYKIAFLKHGKKWSDLETMIRDWCKINAFDSKREDDILHLFRKEVINNRCTFY